MIVRNLFCDGEIRAISGDRYWVHLTAARRAAGTRVLCSSVGRVSTSKGCEPEILATTWFLVMVARSSSSVRRLCTGWSVSVRFVRAFCLAAGDGCAGATIESRSAPGDREYGERLGASDRLQDGGLDRFIQNYPSHGTVVDMEEAKESFKVVGPMTDDERAFAREWSGIVDSPAPRGGVTFAAREFYKQF